MAPANTGSDSKSKSVVINTDQTKSLTRSQIIPGERILAIVVKKLIAPKIEDTPAKCKEKIAKSTAWPEWAIGPESGGYTVQPVPTPASVTALANKKLNAGGNNQNEKLLRRAKAISGAPNNIGTIQLPNPPIKTGITKKKIITKAWEVTTTLYICPSISQLPGRLSSARIRNDKPLPTKALHNPKIKYNVPISLWFVEYNHRIFKLQPGILKKYLKVSKAVRRYTLKDRTGTADKRFEQSGKYKKSRQLPGDTHF